MARVIISLSCKKTLTKNREAVVGQAALEQVSVI